MVTFEINIILCLSLVIIVTLTSQQAIDDDSLLNKCIDSKHHKTEPGPEGALYGQCIPWKEKSCCTGNTSESMHLDPLSLYNFDFNHCGNLSTECRKHFTQDHCFYECSPNVGPWIVTEDRSWRRERYFKIPLCASDCEAWFNACRYDYTCTDNWTYNFDWVAEPCENGKCKKKNVCPKLATCITFERVYRTAENFCQRVWDDAWEYTKDDSFCMRLWFNGSLGNPNDQVAKLKLKQLQQISKASGKYDSSMFLSSVVAIMLFVII